MISVQPWSNEEVKFLYFVKLMTWVCDKIIEYLDVSTVGDMQMNEGMQYSWLMRECSISSWPMKEYSIVGLWGNAVQLAYEVMQYCWPLMECRIVDLWGNAV